MGADQASIHLNRQLTRFPAPQLNIGDGEFEMLKCGGGLSGPGAVIPPSDLFHSFHTPIPAPQLRPCRGVQYQ